MTSRCVCSLLVLGTLAATLLRPSVASAQDRPQPAPDESALGSHQKNFRFDIGARTQFVGSDGLDPFSENDVLPQLTLAGSWAPWAREALSLAAVVGFDYGSTSSQARSSQTSLDVRRFVLGPEARYHVLRLLVVAARVAPTLTRLDAEISTGLDPVLRRVAWKAGVDATLGAAVEVFGYRSGASRKPRLWLTGEGGYGWSAPASMRFSPAESDDAPQRLTPLELEDLSLSGPLFRVTAALSF
jgi:hypothetical protein